jgi:hypothetical protein
MKTSAIAVGVLLFVACKSPAEPATSDASFVPATSSATASASASSAPSASVAPPKDAPGKYPPIDAFCASSYGADLDLARSKCDAEEMKTQEAVAQMAARLCRHDFELLQDRKAWTLDQTSADACVAMLKKTVQPDVKLHEGETFFLRAPCDKLAIGTRGEGESCLFPPECKDGLACDGYKVGVEGKCKKPVKVGEACSVQAYGSVFSELAASTHHASCAKGAYCTDSGKCAARGKAGDACEQHKACGEGLWCAAGKCSKTPFAAAGAACTKTSDCAFGLFCESKSPRSGAEPGRCVAKRAAGEPCTDDQCKGWCDVPPKKKEGTCKASCGSG